MSKIAIKINGNEIEVEENSTVQDVLEQRNVTGTMFVVEKNLEILQKDQYNQIVMKDDSIEIVGFFGGG